MRSAKAERIFTFSPIIVKNAGKKQAGNLLLRKKKISKIFQEKVIFLRKICRFSVENLTFFELFSRNFDAEKGDNQAWLFFHES